MKIILDLDEVLVDFTGKSAEVHGKTLEEMEEIFGNWWSGDDFWGEIRSYGEERFWEELLPLPWAGSLLSWVVEVSNDDWVICTAPSEGERSYVGKYRFLKRAFGERFDRFLITPHKYLLAGEGRLLIDDSSKNCEEFEEHGGESILFPSRFNEVSAFYSDPLTYLKDQYVCI